MKYNFFSMKTSIKISLIFLFLFHIYYNRIFFSVIIIIKRHKGGNKKKRL